MPIASAESEQLNAHQIYRVIKSRGLTQVDAGVIPGNEQPTFRL